MPSLVSRPVGSIGFGLMGFTTREVPIPDEQAFASMKAALTAGANFWNAGEFYGSRTDPYANLRLLNRYFTAYPEDADKVVLSVKGAVDVATFGADASPEGVRRSIDNTLSLLEGKKSVDIFECARVDPKVPYEDSIKAIAEYVKAGKVGGIGISETSAATIRKAQAVHPIASVEVEVSLWATEIFENGVADTCAELGIPIIAYSPLGRGFLTRRFKSFDDIPQGDFRRIMDRFQPGNFEKNLVLVDAVEKVAQKVNVTPAQLALAWIRSKGNKSGKATIIPIPAANDASRVKENMKDVTVAEGDLEEVEKEIKRLGFVGGRYNEHLEGTLYQ